MSTVRQFGAITKIEDQADGTIKVWGVASSEAVDHAGEKITADAMKAALPDYSKFPALREMHEPLAAGKVLEADVDGAGVTQICAHVVDPLAITKVKTGVYAGFSIGGKVLKRDPTDRSVITSLRLVEISLVDSPCNPDAVISMWKADMTEYVPTGDEVVAKARELATEAGSRRYKDFLFKARETLISDALSADLGDDEEGDDVTKVDEAQTVDVPTDAAEAQAEGTAVEAAATDEAKLAADQADAVAEVVDPAAALAAAIEKANDVVTVPAIVETSGPFADMTKAGAALTLIAKTIQSDDVVKGLWFIPGSARVLECFGDLASSIAWEERSEGDDASPLPAMAVDILNRLKEFVIAVTTEEVSELLTQITTNLPDLTLSVIDGCCDEVEIIVLANGIIDLVKADSDLMAKVGARNSKRDAAMIQQSHDHMTKLGAVCAKDNCAKVEGVEDDETIKAALAAENERLAKALTEAAPAVIELTKKFETTIADLTKRLEQVESEPAAPKTASGPLRAVTKTEDASPGASDGTATISAEDLQKVVDALPEAERGQLLLRVALGNPIPVKTARAAA
jgi:phage head maturation protease